MLAGSTCALLGAKALDCRLPIIASNASSIPSILLPLGSDCTTSIFRGFMINSKNGTSVPWEFAWVPVPPMLF